jgi:hypothetical protein
LALKGKQPLEEVLSLTILVLTALALPISPLYMYMRDLWEVREFHKIGLGQPPYMSDLRELGERFLSNTCCRNFVFKNHKNPSMEAKK